MRPSSLLTAFGEDLGPPWERRDFCYRLRTMVTRAPSPAVQRVLATATQALQAGNLIAAEMALAPLFSGMLPADPDLLNIAGTLRTNQGRLVDAAALFGRAAAQAPREPSFS